MLFLLSQLFCSLNNSDKESNSFKFSFSFSILHIIHAPVINFDCFLAMLLGLVSYYKQKNRHDKTRPAICRVLTEIERAAMCKNQVKPAAV